LDALLVLLEEGGEASFLALFLDGDQLLLSSLSDLQNVVLGSCLASHREKAYGIGLGHGTQLRVVSSCVALPVRVVGNVTGRDSDGVIVRQGRQRSGGGKPILGVQRDTGRAIGVDGKKAADTLPHTGRSDGVFLRQMGLNFNLAVNSQSKDTYLRDRDDIGCRLGGFQDIASHDADSDLYVLVSLDF
jgi:hypothetical protein